MEIKAVIFDMDGLMFDTERLWLNSVIKTNEVYNYNVPIDLIIECMGKRKDKIDIAIKDKMGRDFDTDKFRNINKKFMKEDIQENGLKCKKGLKELLDFLKQKNIITAVASSSNINEIKQKFEQAKISLDYFDYIIGGNMVTKPKPDPQIYSKCCEVLKIDPKYVIALEDSDYGIEAAYKSGVKPILIPDIKEPKYNTKKMAYKQVNNLEEVIELFS